MARVTCIVSVLTYYTCHNINITSSWSDGHLDILITRADHDSDRVATVLILSN